MKHLKKLHLVLLTGLAACSSVSEKHYEKLAQKHPEVARSLASADTVQRITQLTDGLYYSYLLGQSKLDEFDRILDTDPSLALKSDAYSSLLAIRTFVDHYEHEIADIFLGANLLSADQQVDPVKKERLEAILTQLEKFYEGERGSKLRIPENLRPLILSNVKQSQLETYRNLLEAQGDNLIETKLRQASGSNEALQKKLPTYAVDSKLVRSEIEAERSNPAFREFEEEIKKQSDLMKDYISEVGRETSSAGITPSTGKSGNISGANFPKNTWSLTFDDGPGKTTDQLITNLTTRKLPATFFVLAKQVEALPRTVARLSSEGFDLASHSYTHAQLTKVSASKLEREIGTSKKTIETAIGKPVKLFRLPYGAGVSRANVRSKIAEHKMVHVFWTVDTLDWQDKNPNSILKRTLKQMAGAPNNSGIVLFHDIHSQSVTASTMLMDHMLSKELIVCSVQGVINQMNDELASCR